MMPGTAHALAGAASGMPRARGLVSLVGGDRPRASTQEWASRPACWLWRSSSSEDSEASMVHLVHPHYSYHRT